MIWKPINKSLNPIVVAASARLASMQGDMLSQSSFRELVTWGKTPHRLSQECQRRTMLLSVVKAREDRAITKLDEAMSSMILEAAPEHRDDLAAWRDAIKGPSYEDVSANDLHEHRDLGYATEPFPDDYLLPRTRAFTLPTLKVPPRMLKDPPRRKGDILQPWALRGPGSRGLVPVVATASFSTYKSPKFLS